MLHYSPVWVAKQVSSVVSQGRMFERLLTRDLSEFLGSFLFDIEILPKTDGGRGSAEAMGVLMHRQITLQSPIRPMSLVVAYVHIMLPVHDR